jgi:CBS domain-containing protein
MLRTGHGRLPVFSQGRLVGIITRRDIMDLFQIKTDLGA